MPAQTVNYQCPACTGPLHFAGASGKLECDYCGSRYTVAEIEKLYAEKEEKAAEAQAAVQAKAEEKAEAQAQQVAQAAAEGWDLDAAGSDWSQQEAASLHTYSCPSCGAEIVCDENTAATACVYCGNPTIVPGQLGGMLKPDYVIPFKLEKEAAVSALKAYYKGKKFLPKAFSAANHIEEIQGLYVPFWLFDGEADASIRATATRSHTHTSGDDEITETEHFNVQRAGRVKFQRVPVDGSSKMPDAHMDAIEPFNYAEMVPFSTAYLPGYLADKYDVTAEESAQRANLRVQNTAVALLQSTILGYETTAILDQAVDIRQGQVKYAMLPVWMLHTRWSGKDYLFAMNGQTGKLIGDLPVSRGKFWAWFAGIALPLMVILAFLTGLIGGGSF